MARVRGYRLGDLGFEPLPIGDAEATRPPRWSRALVLAAAIAGAALVWWLA